MAKQMEPVVGAMALPLDKITLGDNPSRVYKESADEFADFKDSIRKLGILQPLLVAKGKKDGEYTLVAGYRRYRAAKELKLDEVPVHVAETKKATPLQMNLQENLKRKNLSHIEIALKARDIFKQKKLKMPKPGEKGEGTALVAKEMGVSRAYVTEHLKLLTLPDKVQLMVHNSEISAQSGFRIANLPEDARDVVIEEAARIEDSKRPKPKAIKAKAGKGAGNKGVRPGMTTEQRQVAEATKGKGGSRISDKSVRKAIGKVGKDTGRAEVAAVAEKGARTLADFTAIIDAIDEGSEMGTSFAVAYRKWLKKDVSSEDLAGWLTSAFLLLDGDGGKNEEEED